MHIYHLTTTFATTHTNFLNIMPASKQFDSTEKAKIFAWISEDVPCKEIAARLGRSVVGVRRMARLLRNLPAAATMPTAAKRTGRPRKTTFQQDERLRRYLLKHPFKTAKQLKAEVSGFSKLSVRSIQVIL